MRGYLSLFAFAGKDIVSVQAAQPKRVADTSLKRRLKPMTDSLESNYDCSNANQDLPQLLSEWEQLKGLTSPSQEQLEKRNRIENQIHFIRNKCGIPKEG